MSMSYDDFKTYLATFLWKDSDTVLLANLDNLIRMGNNKMNRKLRSLYKETVVEVPITDAREYDLPSNYGKIQTVACTNDVIGGVWDYVDTRRLEEIRYATKQRQWAQVYSASGNKLLLSGPASGTINLRIYYDITVPLVDGATPATDNWWFSEFLDLYTYAVLYHAAPFLREDERVPMWKDMYNDAVNEVEEDFHINRKRGQYDALPLSQNSASKRPGR